MTTNVSAPPEPIASDYVELGTLIVMFLVGAPLNLAAYTQIAERPASTRLDILKRHLNYSDLLVLFIYVPSRACWLITYDWRGGDFLCRAVKFLHTFAFQISSNVIVVIAVDRLLSVISNAHHNPQTAHKRMRCMLAVAWVTALVISAPQFAIWRTFMAFECMQIWEIARAELVLTNTTSMSKLAADTSRLVRDENIYMVVHMLCIFWVPATIILVCYVVVSCWVYFNSRPSVAPGAKMFAAVEATSRGARHSSSAGMGISQVTTMRLHSAAICTQQSLALTNRSRGQQEKQQQPTTTTAKVISFDVLGANNGSVQFDIKPRILLNDETLSLLSGSARTKDESAPESGSVTPANHTTGARVPSPSDRVVTTTATNATTANSSAPALLRQSSKSSGTALFHHQNGTTPPCASITSSATTPQMRNSQSSSYSAGKANRNRAIRVSFLLVSAYIVCWLPYNALSLIRFIYPDLFHEHANKVYCLHGMIVFNSVINPYLYGLFGGCGLCRSKARD